MTATWRDLAIVRIAGSAAAWFLFSLCFSLLLQVSLVVMSLGGSCASGGPFEIAVECPDNAWFAPVSIWGGLGAVAISAFFARGFGTPLTTWAWPILFVGLGGAFLLAFVFGQDIVGLIIGGMFVIMGLVPLVLELRGSPQRVFLGQFSASGKQFYEGERARRALMSPKEPNPEGAVAPTFGDWALSLGIVVVAVGAGYSLARAMF
jgi:hypothetical protein